jgi:hypothetical protein
LQDGLFGGVQLGASIVVVLPPQVHVICVTCFIKFGECNCGKLRANVACWLSAAINA